MQRSQLAPGIGKNAMFPWCCQSMSITMIRLLSVRCMTASCRVTVWSSLKLPTCYSLLCTSYSFCILCTSHHICWYPPSVQPRDSRIYGALHSIRSYEVCHFLLSTSTSALYLCLSFADHPPTICSLWFSVLMLPSVSWKPNRVRTTAMGSVATRHACVICVSSCLLLVCLSLPTT